MSDPADLLGAIGALLPPLAIVVPASPTVDDILPVTKWASGSGVHNTDCPICFDVFTERAVIRNYLPPRGWWAKFCNFCPQTKILAHLFRERHGPVFQHKNERRPY